MNHTRARVVICLGVIGLMGSAAGRAGEEATTKEIKRLEGVWASTPAKKGRDRGHVFAFQGGKMGWHSFQTRDGEPVIGHTKLYDIRLNPKASPKQITATHGKGKDRVTLLGIYELNGDKLKVAFGSAVDRERPKKFAGRAGGGIALTRDKSAKVPDLANADKQRQEIEIDPTAKWLGQVRDVGIVKQCPKKPVTTRVEFEKVWKALRGKEKVPTVDFAKEFVLVRTATDGKLTKIGLYLVEGEEKVSNSLSLEYRPGKPIEGFTYIIGVFRRERVDVVDGRIIARSPKK